MHLHRQVGILLLLAGAGIGQFCIAPGTEDFETAVSGTISGTCGTTQAGTLPAGWTTTGNNHWRPRMGPTPTVGTGPFGDHTSGSGLYVHLESTACPFGGWSGTLLAPCVDATTLVSPGLGFWYHMHGASMGTLDVQSFDGTSWSTIWSRSGDQGDAWLRASMPVTPHNGRIQVRFVGSGTFTTVLGDAALDDVTIGDLAWEENDATLGVTVDDREGSALAPAILQRQVASCALQPAPLGVLKIESTQIGRRYDLLLSTVALVPGITPGHLLPDGQFLNVDLSQPFVWLSSGTAIPGLLYIPGFVGLPVPTATITVPLQGTVSLDVSLQGWVADPAALLGVVLSQPTELHATVVPPTPSVAGPTGDDAWVTVDVTAAPTCWSPQGITFFGASWSRLHVSANGRVLFGSPATSPFASPFAAAGSPPFIGFWTDLDPGLAGSVVVGSAPGSGIVRVDYQGVPYAAEPGTGLTFAIELDGVGGVVSLLGLSGIGANPLGGVPGATDDQLLGLGPGSGAIDPGPVTFAPGVSGTSGPLDLLYDFAGFASGTGLVPSLAPGTLNGITFTPLPGAGYAWSAN